MKMPIKLYWGEHLEPPSQCPKCLYWTFDYYGQYCTHCGYYID
jgi:ribosomal protein L37E